MNVESVTPGLATAARLRSDRRPVGHGRGRRGLLGGWFRTVINHQPTTTITTNKTMKNMHKPILLALLALGTSTGLMWAQDAANPPADATQPPPMDGGAPGGPGGPGGPEGEVHHGHGAGNNGGIHILPPGARQKLNLTADQLKQIAALETEVRTKLATILTPEQLQQLKQMRPPHGRGPGGPEGMGGPEGQGGPGGDAGLGGPGGDQGGPGGPPPAGNN